MEMHMHTNKPQPHRKDLQNLLSDSYQGFVYSDIKIKVNCTMAV